MKTQNKTFLIVVLLATGFWPQEMPLANKAATIGLMLGERDKGKEDQVAKLFETLRSDLRRPRLTRIGHRASLEQAVCTSALTGTLPNSTSTGIYGFYKTAQPESISAELNKVALFNAVHPKSNLGFPRYSVAVWRVEDSHTGEATYWVGVHLYNGAIAEFIDDYFTDDIQYHNDWKKSVAPQCRGN